MAGLNHQAREVLVIKHRWKKMGPTCPAELRHVTFEFSFALGTVATFQPGVVWCADARSNLEFETRLFLTGISALPV